MRRARRRPRIRPGGLISSRRVKDNEIVKRLVWSALLAGFGALSSLITTRMAALVWRQLYGEDPPE